MTEPVLPWWKDAIFYQVYVRSFQDSSGDGIGDLQGVKSRLGYLEDLGVSALWLSPIFPSPMRDCGYDVSNYCDIDPSYGTLDDFDQLVAEANRRKLRIILDWVPNHTSSEHPWFIQAASSRSNRRRDWYVWRDAPKETPPNNWRSGFSAIVGPRWTFHEPTNQWYLHSFLPEQPDLNWDNPEVVSAMHDTMTFWLERGVDGFRIDQAHTLGKHPHYEDNPFPIVKPSPETAGIRRDEDYWPNLWSKIKGIRAVADRYSDSVLVGEAYVLDPRRLAAYTQQGRLHLSHDFSLAELEWDAQRFADAISQANDALGVNGWPAWIVCSHDHSRLASRWDENNQEDSRMTGRGIDRTHRAVAVYALLYLMRGTPFIFQGEELGLTNSTIPDEAIVDVDGRDPVRTPIPWTRTSTHAGFTTGTPWLPVTDTTSQPPAASQQGMPDSTLETHRALIRLRNNHPVIRFGSQRVTARNNMLTVERHRHDQAVSITINMSAQTQRVALGTSRPLLVRNTKHDERTSSLEIDPDGFAIVEGRFRRSCS